MEERDLNFVFQVVIMTCTLTKNVTHICFDLKQFPQLRGIRSTQFIGICMPNKDHILKFKGPRSPAS
jgi:hypothetical protein